jgi:prolipoprotein diacylglyceryltransferase
MSTKIITGEERLIYYHQEIAVMVMAAIFLKITNQPLLPYLDITILGIGTFLFCGRVGCLMVGCCHGRPHQWGVCYRKEHADVGFTHYYVGIRLFPIQAVESLWVFGIVVVGVILIVSGRPHGEALAWYVINYDIGRFIMEFFRGDPERPYYLGYSQGQWISIILMGIVVWGELAGILAFHAWHAIATFMIITMMIIITLTRKFQVTLDGKPVKKLYED